MQITPGRLRAYAIMTAWVAVVVIVGACDQGTGRIVGLNGGTSTTDSNAVASVSISPTSASTAVGTTQAFSAIARNSTGKSVAATISWTSSNPSVATVNGSGSATALGAGTATISAIAGGVSGNAALTVTSTSPP